MGCMKSVVRFAIIGGLVGVAGLAIVGPVRARLLMDKARTNIHTAVDSVIDDPAALRAQIRDLEAQYAPRIAAVRSDLAQLREQVSQLKREQAVATRVVDLASNDLSTLHGMLARAQSVQDVHSAMIPASYSPSTGEIGTQSPEVRINFNNESLTVDQAVTKATRVEQVVASYTSRQVEIERDLGFMGEQEHRMADLLEKLEAERSDFQAQLFQLDHQVDAISRNERMITIMEKRQETIDKNSRYESGSLDNLKGKLAEIRTKQEAQLESLGKGSTTEGYENKAKIDLDSRPKARHGWAPLQRSPKPAVIQINPGDALTPLPQIETSPAPSDNAKPASTRASSIALKK
mgnify:FL=1